MYFGWIPPNTTLFGKEWSIVKKNGTFKLTNGKTIRKVTEKDIINAVCWRDSDGKCVIEKNLPDFTTQEGYSWLVPTCFKHDILIRTGGTIPDFTKDYFILFRNVLYDLLKEKEKENV